MTENKKEPKFYSPKFFGVFVKESDTKPYKYDRFDYKTTDEKKVKVHKELLQVLEKKENDRLGIIDTKTSQLITFTGIIFSALSLFIPILLDKITDQSIFSRIIFILGLIFAFSFYILTIHNAIRNYNILKFIYSNSDPNNVIKYQDKTVDEFTTIEIQDLLFAYNQNLKTNNDKANNLIYAFRSFRIAIFFTALIGIFLCSSLLFSKPKNEDINIKIPVQIQNFDSTTNEIIETIRAQINLIIQPYACEHDTTSSGMENRR